MRRASAFFTLTALAGALALQAACSSGGSGGSGGATGTGGGTGAGTTTSTTTTTGTTTSTSTTTTTTTGTGGMPADAGSDAPAEAGGSLCTQTGGTETMKNCCASQGDFPNSCTLGTCTCAPGSSHMVKFCNCPAPACYDPVKGCSGGP